MARTKAEIDDQAVLLGMASEEVTRQRVSLGIDVGSVSVKCVVTVAGAVIRHVWLRNQGIIATVKAAVSSLLRRDETVGSVGVTGSGREFAAALVGADVIETEILAHAVAGLHLYPLVSTIFDIGGEDSKIIAIRNGTVSDFCMNLVCGAGTGSVVEAIAARMGVPIDEVGGLAAASTQRLDIPGKCGVFAQSAVVSRLNSGADKADVLMGVIRALVGNYLSLAGGLELRGPYLFQGATARNEAVIKALSEALDSKVIVPPLCGCMGALGAALLAERQAIAALLTERQAVGPSRFKGQRFLDSTYTTRIVSGDGCANACQMTVLFEADRAIAVSGNRCPRCVDWAMSAQL